MHYVDLFPIGVFGKSGTSKIWGGAFAPPAPPGYATGTLIFRQSDVHFEYVVINYLQLAN